MFLGVRLQCAKCHNHPFDRWTQDDYYAWASVFAQVKYKVLENKRRDNNDKHEFDGEQVVYTARQGGVTNDRTGQPADPQLLGQTAPLAKDADRLASLATWLAEPSNPWFARVQVNRVWSHLMGRGLVDPIDDFRATNPASHPELLDELTENFVENGGNLRTLVRTICTSYAYAVESEPTADNGDDKTNYSRNIPRRLSAEQLADALQHVLDVPSEYNGYPAGVRAGQLPGVMRRGGSRRYAGGDDFLKLFGKPPRLLTCECERSTAITMNQAFTLISGERVNDLLAAPENRLSRMIDESLPAEAMIEELYWTALSRAPNNVERYRAAAYLAEADNPRRALEDLAWALVNSKEFLLRR